MNAPRPIVYIHHESAIGGAPLSLLYLIRKLDRARYEPRVVCLREGPAAEMYRKEGLPVEMIEGPDLSHTELVWFSWSRLPKLALRLLQSLPLFFRLRRALKPDRARGAIAHLNSSTLLTAALAARSLSMPVVWHIREPLARGYLGLRRAILRWSIRSLATRIVAISHNDAAQLGLTQPSPQWSVIHNFVDFAEFDATRPSGAIRRELKIPDDAPVILFLGGCAAVKGADILIEAIPTMLGSLRSAHVILAGETSPEFQIRAKAPHLVPFQNRLHLVGPRRDVPALLADTNILLFPSIVPHFARPVIEAAAMAKPAIASDLDGVRELVRRNETAMLVPPSDPVALARAVMELTQDPPRAYRLGQQGLALAREKFDASKNAAATLALYEQIPP